MISMHLIMNLGRHYGESHLPGKSIRRRTAKECPFMQQWKHYEGSDVAGATNSGTRMAAARTSSALLFVLFFFFFFVALRGK